MATVRYPNGREKKRKKGISGVPLFREGPQKKKRRDIISKREGGGGYREGGTKTGK